MARLDRLVPQLTLLLGLGILPALGVGCAGAASIQEIPPVDEEESVVLDPNLNEALTASANWSPDVAGPHVRLGLRHLATGQRYAVEGSACEEVIVYVSAGRVQDGGAVRNEGTLLRTQDRLGLTALESTRLVVALVTASGDCVFTDDMLRHHTAGQSVDVMLPPNVGAYGTFTITDDPPSARHSNPMDEAFLVEGEGVLLLREADGSPAQRSLVSGEVVHIPAGRFYGIANASEVFRMYRVLTPPLAVTASEDEDSTEAVGSGRPDGRPAEEK